MLLLQAKKNCIYIVFKPRRRNLFNSEPLCYLTNKKHISLIFQLVQHVHELLLTDLPPHTSFLLFSYSFSFIFLPPHDGQYERNCHCSMTFLTGKLQKILQSEVLSFYAFVFISILQLLVQFFNKNNCVTYHYYFFWGDYTPIIYVHNKNLILML